MEGERESLCVLIMCKSVMIQQENTLLFPFLMYMKYPDKCYLVEIDGQVIDMLLSKTHRMIT